jgi:hypothetical protein
MISSGRIAQHRNYGELMARHEKEQKIKRIVRMFVYFLIILFLILVYLIVKRVEEKSTSSRQKQQGSISVSSGQRT